MSVSTFTEVQYFFPCYVILLLHYSSEGNIVLHYSYLTSSVTTVTRFFTYKTHGKFIKYDALLQIELQYLTTDTSRAEMIS